MKNRGGALSNGIREDNSIALFHINKTNADFLQLQNDIKLLNLRVDTVEKRHADEFQSVVNKAQESRDRINETQLQLKESMKEAIADVKQSKKDIADISSTLQAGMARMEINLLNNVSEITKKVEGVRGDLLEYVNTSIKEAATFTANHEQLKIESKVFRFVISAMFVCLLGFIGKILFKGL